MSADTMQEAGEARLEDILSAIIAEPACATWLGQSLRFLMMADVAGMQRGIDRLNREQSIGPLLNPTAYLGMKRYDNAEKWKDILGAAIKLRRTIDAACKPE